MKARTAAANQLHSLSDTAPESIRALLRPFTFKQKIATAERWRPRTDHSVEATSRRALASVARRWRALDTEAKALAADIKVILDELAPQLLARHGVGYETASQLLIAAGDNPHRLAHERSYAALCGASPVEASSGKTNRHRLNRGGDRQANSALWTIARVRMASHPPTKTYVQRRTADGLSKLEIIRCLKRYIARELFPDIQAIVTPLIDNEEAHETA
jgi:transposase